MTPAAKASLKTVAPTMVTTAPKPATYQPVLFFNLSTPFATNITAQRFIY
jgi:hypothetical protein